MYQRPFPRPHPYQAQPVSGQRVQPNSINNSTYPLYEPVYDPFTYYAKPKQPTDWFPSNLNYSTNQEPSYYNQENAFPSENAAPYNMYANGIPYEEFNEQAQATNPLLSQFQDSEGKMDVDKMLNTVGQLANTYHQVVPIIKEVSAIVKLFR